MPLKSVGHRTPSSSVQSRCRQFFVICRKDLAAPGIATRQSIDQWVCGQVEVDLRDRRRINCAAPAEYPFHASAPPFKSSAARALEGLFRRERTVSRSQSNLFAGATRSSGRGLWSPTTCVSRHRTSDTNECGRFLQTKLYGKPIPIHISHRFHAGARTRDQLRLGGSACLVMLDTRQPDQEKRLQKQEDSNLGQLSSSDGGISSWSPVQTRCLRASTTLSVQIQRPF